MQHPSLKCSHTECKARLNAVEKMSLEELETYATKCSTCGSWILKDDPIANHTYLKISNKWAEAFNQSLFKNH
ncbi:MAG: hypothetical protein JW802_06040 [Campylobacterales bacterium]|nr:hypothetical protein [Campylobacterales bacterium]